MNSYEFAWQAEQSLIYLFTNVDKSSMYKCCETIRGVKGCCIQPQPGRKAA